MRYLHLGICILVGLALAAVDPSPGFDDTGVLVTAILAAAILFGAIRPARAWLVGLTIGGWIPLANIIRHGDYGTLVALAIALTGAYVGAALRLLAAPAGPSPAR